MVKTLADLRITVIFEDQLPPERIISFVGSDKEEESQYIYLRYNCDLVRFKISKSKSLNQNFYSLGVGIAWLGPPQSSQRKPIPHIGSGGKLI